jgi:hypothetical protein
MITGEVALFFAESIVVLVSLLITIIEDLVFLAASTPLFCFGFTFSLLLH